ncbi:basic amino acid ABC transporter substrate-binding protein [Brevibacillus reuszeri]|uniref:basic amino acid ABC transporter substrate-binding protein n=1 Tax=Brevibacillus reuszeri TaxID=54915 RepID=UPI003D261D7E
MKNLSSLVTTVAVGILTLAVVGCSSTTAPQNVGEQGSGAKVIKVAVINDYPPFEFKKDGELTGFDYDLMNAIAKEEKLEIDWKEMKFDGLIPALQAKQIDAAISAITIRDDRKQVVDFSEPYFQAGQSLVVKKESSVQKLEDLKGKTIVATQGAAGLMAANDLSDKYGANVKILKESAALFLEVETGNSEGLVNDFPGVAYKIKIDGDQSKLRIVGDPLTVEEFGIAVVKGNKEVVDKLNNGLKKLKENGEYKKLFDTYFGK